MKDYLHHFDRQIEDALRIGNAFHLTLPRGIRKVLFCGMGGSAIGGDVLRELVLQKSPLVFEVNRSPRFPRWALGPDTLVIFSSYSGNTRETLEHFNQTEKSGARRLILTSGGRLRDQARLTGTPCILIPSGMMPRLTIGYTVFSILPLFRRWGWASFSAKDQQALLRGVRKAPAAAARRLAGLMHERNVHFYGTAPFAAPVVARWRGQLAENAKMLASGHLLPEMFHNEIEGWDHPATAIRCSTAVFFEDVSDPAWIGPKIRKAVALIKAAGGKTARVASSGKSLLERIFSLIVLGDWVSYELSLLNGVDPMPIPKIEAVKKA